MSNFSKFFIPLIITLPLVAQVGTWTDVPTLTEVRSIRPTGDGLFIATDGGVLTFDPAIESFSQGVLGQRSENLDVNVLFVDSDSLLWIGARSPGPVVEVFDLNDGSKVPVEFVDLDQITSFAQVGDSIYATYTDGIEGGLVLYRKSDTNVEYLDQFSHFPAEASGGLTESNNLVQIDGKLIFRSQQFILWSAVEGANLKDPQNWNYAEIPRLSKKINRMGSLGDSLILAIDKSLYVYDFSSFTSILTSGLEIMDVQAYSTDPTKVMYATSAAVYDFGIVSRVVTPIQSIADIQNLAEGDNEIWVGSSGDFLSKASQDSLDSYSANRPRDHLFNRMVVNGDGELIAGARNGLNLLSHLGWRTIIPGGSTGSFNASLYDWNSQITDTLVYTGAAVVEDMILDHDNNIFISLQGRGVLKVDGGLTGQSSFYDASNDVLEPTFNSETYVLPGQMAVDSENNIYLTNKLISDGGSSVTIITPEDSVYHVMHDFSALSSRTVKSIAIDDNDLIWVGSQIRAELQATGGIHFVSREGLLQDGQKLVSYLSGDPLASNEILQLEVDHNNTLWILTTAGVQSMPLPPNWLNNSELRNWANLYMTDTYWQLTDFNVTGIEIDQRGNRWFLSSNAGVHVYQANGRWINDGYGYNTSNSNLSDNAVYAIAFNSESGETFLSTSKGISVLKTPFANPKPDYSALHIYPQPFKPGFHENVIVQGLMDNSSIKILTISGGLVRDLTSENDEILGYEAQWDGRDQSGDLVGSGVYLLYIFNEDGTAASQKIAVVR